MDPDPNQVPREESATGKARWPVLRILTVALLIVFAGGALAYGCYWFIMIDL